MSDTIADFLIQIKNGYLSKKKEIVVPFSNINKAIADILVREGYLSEVKMASQKEKTKKAKVPANLEITLKYEKRMPVITDIKKVSKPGLRIYHGRQEQPKSRSELGITILSTSRGMMTAKEAHKQGVGGEIICRVW